MPQVVWCVLLDEPAFALVVNTNEKTTAASMPMSTFFALKFFVAITLLFLIVYTILFVVSVISFRRCKVKAVFGKKQEFRRLLPEFVATAPSICDKPAPGRGKVSQRESSLFGEPSFLMTAFELPAVYDRYSSIVMTVLYPPTFSSFAWRFTPAYPKLLSSYRLNL